MRSEHVRKIERESQRRRVRRFRALGLNSKGRPYRRTPNLPAAQRAGHIRQREMAKYFRRRDRRAALGLNSRGQAYVRRDYVAVQVVSTLLAGRGKMVAALRSRK